ncbi:hypothetical protein FJY93_04975 [Candidatus Kaiserbacteria bacterium]|nr:hypothetical protein [Candidatus Kaiserbacteria bacterium]
MNIAIRQSVFTLLLSIALISFISLPFFASAQTTNSGTSSTATTTTGTDVNAQIAALLEKIQQLKQQIVQLTSSIRDVVPDSNAGNGNTSTTPAVAHARMCAHFARNLVAGSQGDDVRTLQHMLVEHGLLEADNATGFFGAHTQAALARFQTQFGVGSSTGTFGPLTRGFLQRWCAKLTQTDTNATSTMWQFPPVPQWTNASTTWPSWNYPTTTWTYPPTTAAETNAWNAGSNTNSANPPIPPMRLQRGMSSEYVKKIQQILASRNDGTFTAEHVTGYFGPMTEEALKRFQTNLGIEPLGFVGPQTLQRINEIIASSGLLDPADNAKLQNAIDEFRQMQQEMSNSSSTTTPFDLQRLKELLGRIQGLRQNTSPSSGQNPNSNSGQYPDTCGKIQCLVYQPVCGSDGRTYSCGAADANSCGVQVVHSGACRADNTGTTNPPTPSGTHSGSDTSNPVACTMDAMMCPDGSYVGRTGPNCTFVCPTTTSSGNPLTPSSGTNTGVNNTDPTACTRDVMQCPDGSYVGRTGPKCTFVCPTNSGTPPTLFTSVPSVPGFALCQGFSRTIELNAQGADVLQLQKILASNGLLGSESVTGFFGPQTQNALKQLQSRLGIDPVGILGPTTRDYIASHCSSVIGTNSGM